MEGKMIVSGGIVIDAPPERVWDALVNPIQTKKYMFGCETVSDWEIGSPLLWKGVYEGKEMVFVKGEIVDIKPGSFLAYTTIDPNSGIEDIPENYVTVTYELVAKRGKTELTATQGDFSSARDGERRYKETIEGGGWDSILQAIKGLVEEPKA
jgi:uncharacterized protein YndB with AHSA1/START domain